jgi:GNAT superfamily N-acetyltransferase
MTDTPVRWATADDDAALRRLCRRTPIVGPISYCLEREPDFFALTKLQGEAGGRIAVIDHGDDIVAMAMMAPHRVWIGGQSQRVAYLGDLKVDPDHRHRGLAGLVVRFLADQLSRMGIDRSYFIVLTGNPAFAGLEGSSKQFALQKLRSVRNFLVPFGSLRTGESDIVIARATPEAIQEMLALWNRVNGLRAFAPVLDERLFAQWISGSLSLADFRLARRNGSLVGFCATWDASAIKQIRLLRLSVGLLLTTKMYNIAAPFLRRPKFPSANEHLRFLYVSHICAESSEILQSLLETVHDEHRGDGHLYFDLALDRADPLSSALAHFRSMKVEFDVWEACTGAPQTAVSPPEPSDYAYFDVSFV